MSLDEFRFVIKMFIAQRFKDSVIVAQRKQVSLYERIVADKDSVIQHLNLSNLFLQQGIAESRPSFFDRFIPGAVVGIVVTVVIVLVAK